MIRLASLLTIILVYNFLLVVVLKEKFGKCLPASFIILSFELFVCSIIGSIYYLKYLVGLSLIICAVSLLWKRKLISNDAVKNYFNISLIVFVLLFVFICLRTKNIYLSNIDDLHYYSRLVKDVMRNGVVYTDTLKTTVNPGFYPPFCVFLQSAFCVILGGYSEPNLIFSMVLFSISFFMILFDRLEYKLKDIIKGLIILSIVFVVTLSIQQNRTMSQQIYIYNSIYNDWLISIIAAYIYYLVFSKNTNLPIVVVTGTALCLIKPHSLPLYLLAIFSYVIKEFFYNHKNVKELIKPILILLIPLLVYALVDIYKGSFSGRSMLDASVSALNGASAGKNRNLASELLVNYSKALIFEPVMSKPFEMSYAFIVVIQTALLGLISRKYKLDVIISYVLGAIGYAVMLYFTFLSRGTGEGLGLVMYGRYMQTYTYIGMLLIMYLLIEYRDKLYIYIAFLLGSILFVDSDSIKYINPFEKIEIFKENERKELQYYFDTQYKNEKMIVLNSTNINYYALIENIIDTRGDNVQYIAGSPKDLQTYLKEFIKACNKNELLLIGDYDDLFDNNVWKKITNQPCYNSSLYKILKNKDGTIDFELLYIWGK